MATKAHDGPALKKQFVGLGVHSDDDDTSSDGSAGSGGPAAGKKRKRMKKWSVEEKQARASMLLGTRAHIHAHTCTHTHHPGPTPPPLPFGVVPVVVVGSCRQLSAASAGGHRTHVP